MDQTAHILHLICERWFKCMWMNNIHESPNEEKWWAPLPHAFYFVVWKNSLSCYEWLWCRMNKNGWIVKKINEVKINAMDKWRQVRNTITLESSLQLWCIVLAVRYTVRKSMPSYPICGMNTFHLAPDDGATTYIVDGNKSRGAVTFVYHHHLHWKRKLHDKLHMVPMPEVLFGCKQKNSSYVRTSSERLLSFRVFHVSWQYGK